MIPNQAMLLKALEDTVGMTILLGTGAGALVFIGIVMMINTKMEKNKGGKQDESLKLG